MNNRFDNSRNENISFLFSECKLFFETLVKFHENITANLRFRALRILAYLSEELDKFRENPDNEREILSNMSVSHRNTAHETPLTPNASEGQADQSTRGQPKETQIKNRFIGFDFD
jgi:hypothetical protein